MKFAFRRKIADASENGAFAIGFVLAIAELIRHDWRGLDASYESLIIHGPTAIMAIILIVFGRITKLRIKING